jgi:hypothetical protein
LQITKLYPINGQGKEHHKLSGNFIIIPIKQVPGYLHGNLNETSDNHFFGGYQLGKGDCRNSERLHQCSYSQKITFLDFHYKIDCFAGIGK